MVIQGRIQTKERLSRFLKLENANCVLCGLDAETIQHLYFGCEVTQTCLTELKGWLGWKTKKADLNDLIRWIQKTKISKFRRQVMFGTLAVAVYSIWIQRNRKIWASEEFKSEEVIRRVKDDIKRRVKIIGMLKCNVIDSEWFMNL